VLQAAGDEGEKDSVLDGLQARLTDLRQILVPERLTLAEAASAFGVKASTLRRGCWSGSLPGEKRGKIWFVPVADLQQYLSLEIIESGDEPVFGNDEPKTEKGLSRPYEP